MHHTPKPHDQELIEKLSKEIDANVGPTGKFPEGKLTSLDEGEVQYGVAHTDGKVIVRFGTPIGWLGMSPDQAEELAACLIEHAKEAR